MCTSYTSVKLGKDPPSYWPMPPSLFRAGSSPRAPHPDSFAVFEDVGPSRIVLSPPPYIPRLHIFHFKAKRLPNGLRAFWVHFLTTSLCNLEFSSFTSSLNTRPKCASLFPGPQLMDAILPHFTFRSVRRGRDRLSLESLPLVARSRHAFRACRSLVSGPIFSSFMDAPSSGRPARAPAARSACAGSPLPLGDYSRRILSTEDVEVTTQPCIYLFSFHFKFASLLDSSVKVLRGLLA